MSRFFTGGGGFQSPLRMDSQMTPAVKMLLIINASVYFVQLILPVINQSWLGLLEGFFAVDSQDMKSGHIWQPFSYMFLHSYQDTFHILWNMFWLYICGRDIERILGTPKFWAFYLLCGVFAGLFTAALPPYGSTIGASGAIAGIMMAFGIYYWDRMILLIIIPVPVKFFIIFKVAMDGVAALRNLADTETHVDAICHVGGYLCGYLLVRYDKKRGTPQTMYPFLTFFSGLKKKAKKAQSQRAFTQAADEKARVDVLLDKISREGMTSLSDEEKNFLNDFSRRQADRRND